VAVPNNYGGWTSRPAEYQVELHLLHSGNVSYSAKAK
jgi:hypothetical protein